MINLSKYKNAKASPNKKSSNSNSKKDSISTRRPSETTINTNTNRQNSEQDFEEDGATMFSVKREKDNNVNEKVFDYFLKSVEEQKAGIKAKLTKKS